MTKHNKTDRSVPARRHILSHGKYRSQRTSDAEKYPSDDDGRDGRRTFSKPFNDGAATVSLRPTATTWRPLWRGNGLIAISYRHRDEIARVKNLRVFRRDGKHTNVPRVFDRALDNETKRRPTYTSARSRTAQARFLRNRSNLFFAVLRYSFFRTVCPGELRFLFSIVFLELQSTISRRPVVGCGRVRRNKTKK